MHILWKVKKFNSENLEINQVWRIVNITEWSTNNSGYHIVNKDLKNVEYSDIWKIFPKWHVKKQNTLTVFYLVIKFQKTAIFTLIIYFFLFIKSFFLHIHLWHMEVPRLEIKLELQLQAYATAQILSHICNLCSSLHQLWILNILGEARDWTCIFTETMSGS